MSSPGKSPNQTPSLEPPRWAGHGQAGWEVHEGGAKGPCQGQSWKGLPPPLAPASPVPCVETALLFLACPEWVWGGWEKPSPGVPPLLPLTELCSPRLRPRLLSPLK